MKANELMIGDLLKWKEQPGFNDEDRNMVLCVKNIFDDAIKIDGRFELYHISLFEPIPLTTEILEKNGFKREGGASYWHEGGRDACVIHWGNGKEQLIIGSPCDDCMVKMNVRFIHELQHAFRLVGIEKEIVL